MWPARKGVTFKLINAGHILGSCFIQFMFPGQGIPDFRVIFSGGLGCTGTQIYPEETAMRKAEMLKKKLDQLPLSMLGEVEQLIKEIENRKQSRTILSTLAECAIDDDLPPDYAKCHDHYLYGVPKK